MTKRRKKKRIQSATKAEHMIMLAIFKQEKQLEAAQGAVCWVRIDKMTGQIVPAAPIRAKLEAQIKAKRQILQFLQEGRITQ